MRDESQASPAGRKLYFDEHPRVLGVVFLVLGLISGLVAFSFPLYDAFRGAPKITFIPKAIYAFVIFTILGFTIIILGPRAVSLAYSYVSLRGWKKMIVVVTVIIISILIAEVVRHFFEQFLGKYGYEFAP